MKHLFYERLASCNPQKGITYAKPELLKSLGLSSQQPNEQDHYSEKTANQQLELAELHLRLGYLESSLKLFT